MHAHLLILATTVLWGGSFVATRYALGPGGLGPFSIMFGRYAIATALLAAVVLARGPERLARRDLRSLVGVGIIYPGLYMIFETLGIRCSSATVAAIVIASVPALTAVLARTA